MNTMQTAVVTLLKSAVTQQSYPLPEDFDLDTAYPQLKRHHMASLLYEGAVLCGVDQQLPVMGKLFESYCKSLLVSQKQMREIDRIFQAFDENGVDYLPMKGCNLKPLYPKHELRMMGDADILIRMEQYDRIKPIMEMLGYEMGAESDHELQWIKKSLFVELHKRVIPSYNQDFYAYFGEGWKLAARKAGTRYEMCPADELVYLFTHFAKHYRDGGIGCRHVLDLWVFLQAHPDLDEEKVKQELDHLHLREFYENIRRLMQVWFEEKPSEEKTDFITDFLFDSGSWGKKETHTVSMGLRDQAGKSGGRIARWKYLLRVAFPGVEAIKDHYTFLEKAPWLLPFVWIYRPVHRLFSKEGRRILGNVQKDLQTLSPKTVSSHQEALQYVGLEFHF